MTDESFSRGSATPRPRARIVRPIGSPDALEIAPLRDYVEKRHPGGAQLNAFLGTKTKSQAHRKAGHRSWSSGNAPVPGEHAGDFLCPKTRSAVMSRIKGKNTTPERIICAALEQRGVSFSRHVKDLPGRPDIAFLESRLVVFIDGDFWHGWRFPLWQHKLSEKWKKKIAATRERDQRHFRLLRRRGWNVLRIWEHQIERSPDACLKIIIDLLAHLHSCRQRSSSLVLKAAKRSSSETTINKVNHP